MLVSADGLALSCGQPPAMGTRRAEQGREPRGLAPSPGVCRFPSGDAATMGDALSPSEYHRHLPSPPLAGSRPAFPGQSRTARPTSPPRPRTPFPSTGAVFLLAGTKGKGRKPKGKPFLTLKTPEDTELNCHHTKPTGRQQTPNQPLRTTAGLVRGWANMPTQHETPQEVLTTGLAYPLPKAWPGTALYQAE